jgi:hypothetical protein
MGNLYEDEMEKDWSMKWKGKRDEREVIREEKEE